MTKHGQNGTQVIIQACSSSLLMLVDHRILWEFKALGSFLLDDLCTDGHPNVKSKNMTEPTFFSHTYFYKKIVIKF